MRPFLMFAMVLWNLHLTSAVAAERPLGGQTMAVRCRSVFRLLSNSTQLPVRAIRCSRNSRPTFAGAASPPAAGRNGA